MRGPRSVVWRAQREESVHAFVTAEALHVVARNNPTHGMPDHVDALVPGFSAEPLDEFGKAPRHLSDITGERAVVQAQNATEPASTKLTAQQRENGTVVDHAVDQQDGSARCFDVTDDQTTLRRRQVAECEPTRLLPGAAFDETPRVEREMRGAPRHLQCRATEAAQRQQRTSTQQGATARLFLGQAHHFLLADGR